MESHLRLILSTRKVEERGQSATSVPEPPPGRKRPSLIQSVRIFGDKECYIILIYAAFFFVGFYLVITSVPSLLASNYGLNYLRIGLCFISMGVVMSRFMEWNFRRHSTKAGVTIDKNKQQNLRYLPIERIRLQMVLPVVPVACAIVIAYGFLIQNSVELAGPLVFLYLNAVTMSCSFQGLSALIVDLNRERASSASAAMNLSRCWLGAGASALAVPLVDAIGMGLTSVIAAGIWLAILPVVAYLIKKGPEWREAKRSTEQGC